MLTPPYGCLCAQVRGFNLLCQMLGYHLVTLEQLPDFPAFWFKLMGFVDGYSRSALEGMVPHDGEPTATHRPATLTERTSGTTAEPRHSRFQGDQTLRTEVSSSSL